MIFYFSTICENTIQWDSIGLHVSCINILNCSMYVVKHRGIYTISLYLEYLRNHRIRVTFPGQSPFQFIVFVPILFNVNIFCIKSTTAETQRGQFTFNYCRLGTERICMHASSYTLLANLLSTWCRLHSQNKWAFYLPGDACITWKYMKIGY